MLEQKLRLKLAINNKEPKLRVNEFYREYVEAFERLRKPSQKHYEDYKKLNLQYLEYMNKND